MKNCGFTLLETIIVLGIMTMFFAISIPFFTKFTENAKLETSTRSVVSALRTARAYAITNNVPHYVVFETIDSYFVSADSVIPVEKKEKLPTGIKFTAQGFTTKGINLNSACFKSTGELDETAADTSVSLQEQTSLRTKTITVERTTGRARID